MNNMFERLTTNCAYCGGEFDEDGECPKGCYDKVLGPENKKTTDLYVDNFIEIFLSLSKALQNAGGTVKSLEELKQMSAYDLICLLAPNKIRFIYKN